MLHASDMRIPDEAIDEFIEIYKEEYGEEISLNEANEMMRRMLTLYSMLARRMPNKSTSLPAATRPTDYCPQIGFRT